MARTALTWADLVAARDRAEGQTVGRLRPFQRSELLKPAPWCPQCRTAHREDCW